jgi:hypothetical protein
MIHRFVHGRGGIFRVTIKSGFKMNGFEIGFILIFSTLAAHQEEP